ncbi:MAG: hypothetical protein ACOX78_03400 [Lachnospiraceae bacterium]|jgi:protein-tyrosine-phosphatase
MKTFDRILFVSKDGTCRAPLAAAALRQYLDTEQIEVSSRGMIVLFPEPYDNRAGELATRSGVRWTPGYSREISEDDFSDRTLVLTMNSSMKKTLYRKFPNAVNVFTLGEFAGEADAEVKDPSGLGEEALESCFMQIQVLTTVIRGKAELQTAGKDENAGNRK